MEGNSQKKRGNIIVNYGIKKRNKQDTNRNVEKKNEINKRSEHSGPNYSLSLAPCFFVRNFVLSLGFKSLILLAV